MGKGGKKSEAEFVTSFGHWIMSSEGRRVIKSSAAFEFKWIKARKGGKSGGLPDSQVYSHQLEALKRSERGEKAEGDIVGLWHKISDLSVGFKPCDSVLVRNGRGYLVVGYENGGWYMIRVGDYERLRNGRKRGSLEKEEARKAAEVCGKFEGGKLKIL